MPGGRPTKHTKELLAKAHKYLSVWEDQGDAIPSIVALQKYLNISNACVSDWRNDPKKKEFSTILEEIMREQRTVLINKGLLGEFNSNITKLVLGKHGFHERREMSGPEGKPIQVIASEMSAEEAARAYDDIIKQ